MKKAVLFWFVFLLLMYFSSIILVCCKSKTVVLDQVSEKKHFQFDSLAFSTKKIEYKSLEVNDVLQLKVPYFKTGSKDKNCDSLCNAKKEDWLKSFYSKKESGKNSYSFVYDSLNKQVVLNVKLAQTIDFYKDSLAYIKKQLKESDYKKIEIPIKMPLNQVERFLFFSGCVAWMILIFFIAHSLARKKV
jgi:hypothetical protein